MATTAKVDGVGRAPISFIDSTGAQKSVLLSAQTFSGSKPDIADDWATEFDKAADKTTVLAVATPDRGRRADTRVPALPPRGQHDGIRRPPPQPTRRGGYRRRDLTDRNTSDKHRRVVCLMSWDRFGSSGRTTCSTSPSNSRICGCPRTGASWSGSTLLRLVWPAFGCHRSTCRSRLSWSTRTTFSSRPSRP